MEKRFAADALKVFDLKRAMARRELTGAPGTTGSRQAIGEVEEAAWPEKPSGGASFGQEQWHTRRKSCLSRSAEGRFALVLSDPARVAGQGSRPQIGLAYLLARTTDTIADTELVPLEQRLEALRGTARADPGPGETPLDFGALARQQGARGRAPAAGKMRGEPGAAAQLARPTDAQLVREVLDTITSGQELDLRRFAGASAESLVALRTDDELDDYTYRVAGCVGEFWTKMCRAHLFPQAAGG